MPRDGVECESFTVISSDSLPVYDNMFYLELYLGNFAYEIGDKKKKNYLDDNLFETDEH